MAPPLWLSPPFDAEQTRLLDAALEQFCLTGVRRTSLDDIAHRARVNRATVYRRLGPKSQVTSAAFSLEATRTLRAISDAVEAEFDAGTGQQAIIRAIIIETVQALRGNDLLAQLLAADREETLIALTTGAGAVMEMATEFLAGLITRIRALSEAAQSAENTADLLDARLVAGTLTRLTQSLVLTQDGPAALGNLTEQTAFADSVAAVLICGTPLL